MSHGEQGAEEPGPDARVALAAASRTPASAFSISSQKTTHGGHRVDRPQGLRGPAASVWPTSEPISAPTSSTSVGRPVSLPSALANMRLARARDAQQEDARGPGRRPAGPGRRAREQNALRASSPPRSANVSPPRCSVSRPDFFERLRLQLPEHARGRAGRGGPARG